MFPFSIKEIQIKVFSLIDKSEIRTWTWHFWLFYFALIPAIILAIPQIIQVILSTTGPQIPPYDFVNQTFTLDFYHPTFLSIFLSNYTHLEINHLCSNLFFYLVCISIIFFLEKNKNSLVKASVFFFIVLPFLISWISIFYLGSINTTMPPAKGFSGVVFAFLGYTMYLLCKVICEKYVNIEQNVWDNYSRDKKFGFLSLLIYCNLFFLLCIPIMAVAGGTFISTGGALGNGIAHFSGFMCGVLIPIFFEIYQNRQVKFFEGTLLIQIIVTFGYYVFYLIKIRP